MLQTGVMVEWEQCVPAQDAGHSTSLQGCAVLIPLISCGKPAQAKRRCGAHTSRLLQHTLKVAITVHVVNAPSGRPELGVLDPLCGVRGALAAVWAVPLLARHDRGGVRRMHKHVVGLVRLAHLHLADLLADRDERVAEAVELILGLGLRRLNHERARHRPRHCRRVEAVVDEALGDVLDLDAGCVLDRADVEDELVRARAVLAGEKHRVVVFETRHHVVCLEDGVGRRLREAGRAHHRHVGERDGQDQRRAKRRGSHRAERLRARRLLGQRARRDDGVCGQERREVRLDADGAHAGAAAAVRDAERLV
eukprot:258863-Chlamydomonas_euryale.AAC.3